MTMTNQGAPSGAPSPDDDLEVAPFLDQLARLARERGLTRVADLGDLPPYGTPEWHEWLKQHPPLIESGGER